MKPIYFFTYLVLFMFLWSAAFQTQNSLAQGISVDKNLKLSGKVKDIKPGLLTLINQDGKEVEVKFQEDPDSAISLSGGKSIRRMPCKIAVSGRVPFSYVEPGMTIRFTGLVGLRGKTNGKIEKAQVVAEGTQLSIRFNGGQEPSGSDKKQAVVTGRLEKLSKSRHAFSVPKSKFAPRGVLSFEVADNALVDIISEKSETIQPGDEVLNLEAAEMTTGDIVARTIEVKIDGRRFSRSSYDAQLWRKYSNLSNEPTLPRTVRSRYFILRTDISPRSEKVLVTKLDQMIELISGYYRRAPRKRIECFVVSRIENWGNEKLEEIGVHKILRREGVTVSRRLGNERRSIVYSCDNHGVVQHESVHAYCFETFGSTGPTWYSEGMAEVGNYWKRDELAVDIDPVVMDYLSNNKPLSIGRMVAPGQKTGDSWQNYAWRWAFCQLLVQNPNYNKKFKKLGMALMQKENGVSFRSAFEEELPRIEFEYDLYSKELGNGYRIDLCAWDWNTRPRRIPKAARAKIEVEAKRGWQTTPVQMQAGVSYDLVGLGEWRVDNVTQPVNANGNMQGAGKLVAAIYDNYELVEHFEVGTRTSYTPKKNGQLVLRCKDKWTNLEDNDGKLTVYVRRTPLENGDSK